MLENKEIKEREAEESKDQLEDLIPPEDVISFNELRSCADLFRLYQKQQLNISPSFQRKIVWSDRDQTLFVDSLIKQLPIPSLCICYDVKTQWRVVVDGLQRMSTIVRFLDYQNKDWKLSKSSDVDPKISGKLVSEIHRDSPDVFCRLENLTLPITVIRCDASKNSHQRYLFQIFRRLNSGGRRLLNQEIRNCVYQGTLNDYLHRAVMGADWQRVMKVTAKKIEASRYSHEERVLRFHAMDNAWRSYTGNLSVFLNRFMEDKANSQSNRVHDFEQKLNRVLTVMEKIHMPDSALRNKNLIEGVMVGISANLKDLECMKCEELQIRYEKLMKTNPYSIDIKEGMAHTDKVKDRIETAISIFAVSV